MFLEAQFGADHVEPIKEPKLPPLSVEEGKKERGEGGEDGGAGPDEPMEGSAEDEAKRLEERRQAELARLHKIGIPVPGVAIKIDEKLNAKVWLEDLEVECSNKAFGDRVRVVVERAVEITAPLWG